MGRIFLAHPGGARLYSCANCDTALTNRSQLTSMVSLTTSSYRKIINIGLSRSFYLTSHFTLEGSFNRENDLE